MIIRSKCGATERLYWWLTHISPPKSLYKIPIHYNSRSNASDSSFARGSFGFQLIICMHCMLKIKLILNENISVKVKPNKSAANIIFVFKSIKNYICPILFIAPNGPCLQIGSLLQWPTGITFFSTTEYSSNFE